MPIGPVLSLGDAVGSKAAATFSRQEIRDYLDLDAIRQSSRLTDAELLRLSTEHDPGLDPNRFAQLTDIARIHAEQVAEYAIDAETFAAVKRRLLDWADRLAPATPPESSATSGRDRLATAREGDRGQSPPAHPTRTSRQPIRDRERPSQER